MLIGNSMALISLMRRARFILMITLTLLAAAPLAAESTSPWIGDWQVRLAPRQDPLRVGEIRYPQRLLITADSANLKLMAWDQFKQSCRIEEFLLINAGRDLVFSWCGTTKHSDSFTPIHHVKLSNGQLRGVVSTTEKLFEWVGKPVTTPRP